MIQQGCKRIAYLQISKYLSIGFNRLEGYLEALKKYNCNKDEDFILECVDDKDENYSLIKTLLSSNERPDAIFASVEHLAITTYRVCHDLNLEIPKQVKLISFSNLEAAAFLSPSLTQTAHEIGRRAASILLQSLADKGARLSDCKIVIPYKLIIRRSTDIL